MKHWVSLYLCLVLVCLSVYAAGCAQPTDLQWAVRNGELVRIHILANDDSDAAQAVKLQVRDAILEAFTPLLSQVSDVRQAMEIVRENTDLAQRTAEKAVRSAGRGEQVRVEFGVFDFPERIYGGQVVPEGEYNALRIELGEGKGKNWWCVMYPPLCFSGEKYTGEVRFESGIVKWFRQWREKRQHEQKK